MKQISNALEGYLRMKEKKFEGRCLGVFLTCFELGAGSREVGTQLPVAQAVTSISILRRARKFPGRGEASKFFQAIVMLLSSLR
jgi:hypothetical protein